MERDPMAPRKKYLLLHYVRSYNKKNPDKEIERPDGFDPETYQIGSPAREFLKRLQRAVGLTVSGNFDKETMELLIPERGIRKEVMADAHAEIGTHEWPAYSNKGAVLKYLESCGIRFGAPWCAAFVTYILKKNGIKQLPVNPAYCPSWRQFAQEHGLFKPLEQSKPGDLWLWNWNGGDVDHIGFCDEGVSGPLAYYLDGNVGAYGGTVTDASRASSGVAYVIDLVKLMKLR